MFISLSIFFPVMKILVSSANIKKKSTLDTFEILLIYRIKRRGPNMEPWGTPQEIEPLEDNLSLYDTNCFLLERYDFIQFRASPLIP